MPVTALSAVDRTVKKIAMAPGLNKIMRNSYMYVDNCNRGWSKLMMMECLEEKHLSQTWDRGTRQTF